jgi:hypothetical protein
MSDDLGNSVGVKVIQETNTVVLEFATASFKMSKPCAQWLAKTLAEKAAEIKEEYTEFKF